MVLLRTESVELPEYFKTIREVEKQFDSMNVKILLAMWKFGPRNLLEVARRTQIPFTTVYHRVRRLEAKTGRIAYLVLRTSLLGMQRIVILVSANAGDEELVTQALKIPNVWRSISPAEGAFTHLSIHTLPMNSIRDFKKFIRELSASGLITRYQIIPTGDYVPNFPNFKYYNPRAKSWAYPWEKWLSSLRKVRPHETLEDPEGYPLLADKKDLLILKELEKNIRTRFSELTPILGMTLQGVKYRYDRRLKPAGLLGPVGFDVYPYPAEISAYHEVMLEFADRNAMNKFYSLLDEMFFVHGVAKILGRNSIIARTYIAQSQLSNMFAFFSEIAKAGLVSSYSPIRMTFTGRENQTISYELFDDEKGWQFRLPECLTKLSKLTATSKATVAARGSKKARA